MKKLFLLLLPTFLLLSACAGKITVPAELVNNESECIKEVASAIKHQATARVQGVQVYQIKDETLYVLSMAITALADVAKPEALSPYLPCMQPLQTFLVESGAGQRSNNQLWGTIAKTGGVVWGIHEAGNLLSGLTGAAGATTTITGSRVIQDSGNASTGSAFSSSGDGMGTLNTNASGASSAQGGVAPRGNQLSGEISDVAPASNSGSDEGVSTLPFEPEPVVEEPAVE